MFILSIFFIDNHPDTEELETLANFGLSLKYVNKGPVLLKKSIDSKLSGVGQIFNLPGNREAVCKIALL